MPDRLRPAADHREARNSPPAETSPGSKQAVQPGSESRPATFKPGSRLLIEVLQALPGRPISGERFVRPDGTISLGFYGDLGVVGLTRDEVKVKAIEHLRQWLTDEALGLVVQGKDGPTVRVPPARSTRVFVDDTDESRALGKARDWIGALERKLDRVLEELEALRKERAR